MLGFGSVLSANCYQLFAGPFAGLVVGFQGLDARQTDTAYQPDPVVDGVPGQEPVVVLRLGVAVVFVEPKVRRGAR